MRLLSYFFVLCFVLKPVDSYGNWSQEQTSLNIFLHHTNNDAGVDTTKLSQIDVGLSSVKIFQGFGINLGGNFVNNQASKASELVGDDLNLNLSSRVFLSSFSNIDISTQKFENTRISSHIDNSYLGGNSLYDMQKGSASNLSINLGSDQTTRSISFNYEDNNFEQHRIFTSNIDKSNVIKSAIGSLRYQQAISEDTFFVSVVESLQQDNQVSSLDQIVDIRNIYGGFKTSYLGNSSIEVLIGGTQSQGETSSQDLEEYSWRVINTLKLKDYFQLKFEAGRSFQASPDPSFNTADTLTYGGSVGYSLNENLFVHLSLNLYEREFEQSRNSKDVRLVTRLSYEVLSNWFVLANYSYEELEYKQINYDQSESIWGVSIKWAAY